MMPREGVWRGGRNKERSSGTPGSEDETGLEQVTTVGVKSGICQGLPGGRASKLSLEDGGAFGHLEKDKGSLKGTVGARTYF